MTDRTTSEWLLLAVLFEVTLVGTVTLGDLPNLLRGIASLVNWAVLIGTVATGIAWLRESH